MEQLFSYLIQSALVLTVLFIPFQLLLRKERFYALNRAILLGIMIVSLTLPLSRHTLPQCLKAWWHPHTENVQRGAIIVEDLQIANAEVVTEEPSWLQENWMLLIVCLWALGTLGFFCWQVRSLVRLYRIIHNKEMIHEPLSDGNTLFLSTTQLPSFSWMKIIVMSSDDYEENGEMILAHERSHIAHHHSLDKVLLMVVQCLQWWNPFVWLMADALSQVHEYEADLAVISNGINATQYQLLLIRKAAGPAGLALVNGFKHNKLKHRIVMMNNKNNPRGAKSRYLALIPMMLLAIAFTARAEERFAITADNEVELLVNELGQILMSVNGEDRLVKIEELDAIGKEYKTSTILITANRETPMAVIREIKEALRQEGIQKIVYRLPEAMEVEENMVSTNKDTNTPDEDDIYPMVEKEPQYPGGTQELMRFIAENLRYPAECADKGIQGRVTLSFIIEKDGTISSIEEMRSPDERLTTEAIRVVSLMPKWEPGMQDGKTLRVKYVLPISFRLNNDNAGIIVIDDVKTEKKITLSTTFKGVFLVDGKVMSREEIQNLQPSIVQSMEILKDEASINKYIGQYPEAKEGVVIITTKKG